LVATEGLAIARAGGFDALLTTSGPFEHVAAARRIQEALGVAWIADLRDPATVDVTLEGTPVGRLVRVGRRRACRALRHADHLVAATEQVVDRDRGALGRIELLLPGFDAEEWSVAREQAVVPARFEIVFAGRLYAEYRRPDLFLRGLHALATADHLGPEAIQLVYYGRDGGDLLEIARREGCAHLVRDGGFVRPTEVPRRLASASALLLLTNDAGASGVPGGKFFEYLAAHRPILAVPGSDRFVVSTLQSTGAGVVANDPQEVAAVVRAWLHERQQGEHLPFTGDAAAIERFSDAASVERLAPLLDAGREGARSP
jgi:glycosyltransferase involved in cell wall biosynthesis